MALQWSYRLSVLHPAVYLLQWFTIPTALSGIMVMSDQLDIKQKCIDTVWTRAMIPVCRPLRPPLAKKALHPGRIAIHLTPRIRPVSSSVPSFCQHQPDLTGGYNDEGLEGDRVLPIHFQKYTPGASVCAPGKPASPSPLAMMRPSRQFLLPNSTNFL